MKIERHQTDVLILGSGGAGLFAALHALQADPDLDVVDVCLPTPAHVPFGLMVLDAGKHLLLCPEQHGAHRIPRVDSRDDRSDLLERPLEARGRPV